MNVEFCENVFRNDSSCPIEVAVNPISASVLWETKFLTITSCSVLGYVVAPVRSASGMTDSPSLRSLMYSLEMVTGISNVI